ncbi:MAG: hypothetical protein AB1324_06860, partial [Candidatus Micrarchaeota archaeon]
MVQEGAVMRGFVITVMSMALILALIMLALSLRNAQLAADRALAGPLPLVYASFLTEGAAMGLNDIVGPSIYIEPRNGSVLVRLSDSLHDADHSGELAAYGDFLSGELSSRTASEIRANLSNISGGKVTVFINDAYIYTNDHLTNTTLFTRDGGTGASAYDINVTVTAVRANVTEMAFDEDGTMNVTVRVTDLNGTEVFQGAVLPDGANELTVEYANGARVAVSAGRKGGNDGSLEIESSGIGAAFAFEALLPPQNETERIGYEYDAMIDYAQGGIRKAA